MGIGSIDRLQHAIIGGAVLLNLSAYAISSVTAMVAEPGGGLLSRARRLFTDEMPVPCNVWTCGVHFPSFAVATAVLGAIPDRRAWTALVLPQVSFVLLSSLQTALVAWLVCRLAQLAFHR